MCIKDGVVLKVIFLFESIFDLFSIDIYYFDYYVLYRFNEVGTLILFRYLGIEDEACGIYYV